MGVAKGMDDKEYFVPSIVGDFGGKNRIVSMVPVRQKLSVTKSIRKGQFWKNLFNWRENDFSESTLNIRFKISDVKKLSPDEKEVTFIVDKTTFPDKSSEASSVKTLLGELDLSDEVLLSMLRNMLHHVFTKDLLLKLLEAKDMEFILDNTWMYLKADNVAWRV